MDGYQIAVYGSGPLPDRIIRREGLDPTVTQTGVDSLWSERLAGLEEPEARQGVRELSSVTPYPERRVAYGDIAVDSEGCLWVGEYRFGSDPPTRFDVFDAGGRWLGEMQVPEGFEVFEIGTDYVLGVQRDELEVEHVRMYGLSR